MITAPDPHRVHAERNELGARVLDDLEREAVDHAVLRRLEVEGRCLAAWVAAMRPSRKP